MELTALRELYERDDDRYATIYLEGRAPSEDADEQLRLRWKALREQLRAGGATDAVLHAVESELLDRPRGEPQANGRVLVATDAGIVLDEPWDAALGTGDAAHWAALPELGAYLREQLRAVRELVVIADQQGAEVRQEIVAEQHEPRETDAEVVSGSAPGVHKPRGGALSHNQIQRHADENVGRNAQDIVEHVSTLAATFRPRVLVLAGEVQARTAIRDILPEALSEIVVETDHGSRDDNASDEPLVEVMLSAASDESARMAGERAERFQAGLAHGNATQGTDAVATAAERGAVETLLFEDGTPADDEASLLAACAKTSSTVGLVPEGTALTDGVGAVLRFQVDA